MTCRRWSWSQSAGRSGAALVPARLALLAALGPLACSPAWHEARADREVDGILTEYQQKVLANREGTVVYPAPAVELPADTARTDLAGPPDPPRTIDLSEALSLAFTASRDFKLQTESLYLQGLGYSLTRYNFGPILNSTISYLWNTAEGSPGSDSIGGGFGVRQILPTGGTVSLETSLRAGSVLERSPLGVIDAGDINSTAVVNFRQPLLRGAGREVAYESLTQGERNVVYSVRSFELFRQDFAIRVASAYYQLVSRKLQLANDEQNYKDAVFDRNKAEALKQVDRYAEEDVFLARRREITAEDALLVSRTDYQLAVEDFRILIGLPRTVTIEIRDDEPPFEAVRVEPESAVEAARTNRLDLHTQRDQLEDAERQVRLARNSLLPDLELAAGFGVEGQGSSVGRALPDRTNATAGITFEIPLDRQAEGNAYRSSLIALERTKRDLEQFEDELRRDILNSVRELQQIEKRIQLQTEQIEREKRAVAVTQVRYEAGEAQTRDVLDARQGLTSAQNALIDLKVQHFVGRIQLLRALGIFFVNENGMWKRDSFGRPSGEQP
jgi:outer membrane protein TolC